MDGLSKMQNYWTWTKTTFQVSDHFCSNFYKTEIMIISLMEMLELPNSGRVIKFSWLHLERKLWRRKLFFLLFFKKAWSSQFC